MTFNKASNIVGAVLLCLCFTASLLRIVKLHRAEADAQAQTISLAHFRIHEDIVEAYDSVISDYERRNPGVKIKQILVPYPIWSMWMKTRLIGGTAPDIMNGGLGWGVTEEIAIRYYQPLSEWIDDSNPYNTGTDLEGVPWKDTFLDGLTGENSFYTNLQDVFGVPLEAGTVRLYCNLDLLEETAGRNFRSGDYSDFMEICREIQAYAQAADKTVYPIASSRWHVDMLLDPFFASQTQALIHTIDDLRTLQPDPWLQYLQGRWDLGDPAVQNGLELTREIASHMQPGFLSADREEALFYFLQGQAVFLAAGSYEFPSIARNSAFRMQVIALPYPTTDNSWNEGHVAAPPSEVSNQLQNVLGMTRQTDHPELVIDFLQYLTSKRVAERFAREAKVISSVVGVEPIPEMRIFKPRTEGPVSGFDLSANLGAGHFMGSYKSSLHLLVDRQGSTKDFLQSIGKDMSQNLKKDLQKRYEDKIDEINKSDSVLAAWFSIGTDDEEQKRDRLVEISHMRELTALQTAYVVDN